MEAGGQSSRVSAFPFSPQEKGNHRGSFYRLLLGLIVKKLRNRLEVMQIIFLLLAFFKKGNIIALNFY